jgi:hypothetical protein
VTLTDASGALTSAACNHSHCTIDKHRNGGALRCNAANNDVPGGNLIIKITSLCEGAPSRVSQRQGVPTLSGIATSYVNKKVRISRRANVYQLLCAQEHVTTRTAITRHGALRIFDAEDMLRKKRNQPRCNRGRSLAGSISITAKAPSSSCYLALNIDRTVQRGELDVPAMIPRTTCYLTNDPGVIRLGAGLSS